MQFGLTEEQQQLADSERSWLTRHDPIARVRAALDVAEVTVDPAAVSHASASGLIALLTPEMGGTHVDLAVLSEAHGWAASSLPLADLALAAWALGDVGLTEVGGACDGTALTALARGGISHDGETVQLSAPTSALPMAADMAAIAVVGQTAVGDYLALMRNPAVVGMKTLDLTRSWGRVSAAGLVHQAVSLPAGMLDYLRDALAVHRSFDALGAAARLLETTVDYARQREQFGAPIGSFQAVKHHCADMAVAVEAARSVLWAAAAALDDAPESVRRRAVSAAAAYAKSAASKVASTALQVHGGIGFTWEHDLHLLLRRIKVDEAIDGTVAEHRAALVAPNG